MKLIIYNNYFAVTSVIFHIHKLTKIVLVAALVWTEQ